MDAVRPAGDGNVQIVVDDERHAVPAAEGPNLPGLSQKGVGIQLLFPQLHAGHAPLQGGLHLLIQRLPAHPGTVGHGVKPHGLFIALHIGRPPPAVRV